MRRAARVDANQADIVSALQAVGASVTVIGWPVDLLVGIAGRTLLIECKNPSTGYGKRGLNKNQNDFAQLWRGSPVVVVKDAMQAIDAVRSIKKDLYIHTEPK